MSRTRVGGPESLTPEEARKIIIKPYITEKTFNLIERESKIVFIVDLRASKKHVKEALKTLYEIEAEEVNTVRSIRGKKAIVEFASAEKARELATSLGLV
ncbi:MAG: 50S ribosomal protein L23 [Candidatus Nitrosopolaris sp.]|jgi:large subunit ribosomal protein L23